MSDKLRDLKSLIESNIRGVRVELEYSFAGLNGNVKIIDRVNDVEYSLTLEESN